MTKSQKAFNKWWSSLSEEKKPKTPKEGALAAWERTQRMIYARNRTIKKLCTDWEDPSLPVYKIWPPIRTRRYDCASIEPSCLPNHTED